MSSRNDCLRLKKWKRNSDFLDWDLFSGNSRNYPLSYLKFHVQSQHIVIVCITKVFGGVGILFQNGSDPPDAMRDAINRAEKKGIVSFGVEIY